MHKRLLSLFGATVLVASACSPAATTAPSTAPAPSTGASTPPAASAPASTAPSAAASGNFRFAVDGEPTYFSPASNDLPSAWIETFLYNTVMRVNNKGDVVPDMLTAAPEVSADGLTFTLKLKDGVKFHDGSTMTSADVKYTYDIALSNKCSFNPTTCSTFHDNVTSIDAPDPSTIVVHMKQTYAAMYIFGFAGTFIVPKAATQASYQKFVAGSGGVQPAEVKTLADKISAAQGAKECAGDTPPDTCLSKTYTSDMEAIITKAGVALPDKQRYLGEDGQPDPGAYGDAVLQQLTDLNTTLQAGETDKEAAAYRLLDINLNPIGTGPYKFESYKPGQEVDLVRFDDYYLGGDRPAKVLIPVIKDATQASQALQSNNIDWQTEVTSSDSLAALKADQNVKLSEFPDLGYYFFAFNVRPGHAFSDVIARQALEMCIDHKATVDAATENNGQPVNAEVPPGSFFYNPDVPDYTYDQAAATKLLTDNGYTKQGDIYVSKDGTKLQADLYVRAGRPQRVKFAQLAADQVAACGIKLTVKESDFATVLLPLLSYPNKFDIYLGGWANLTDPEDSNIFGCDHVTTAKNPDDNNFTGYCDPAVDALLSQAKQELDRTKRKAILADLQVKMHNDGPYYFLWADLLHRGYSAKVDTNGVLGPIDYTTFYDTWNSDTWIVKQ
jgi:ABC-type transport system substrate-binding protein